jgi:GT2 family glycosyltransferase
MRPAFSISIMRVLNLSQTSNIQRFKRLCTQKKSRVVALSNSALHVLKFEGIPSLVNHIIRFIKGERKMVKFVHIGGFSYNLKEEQYKYEEWIRKSEPDAAALELQRKNEKNFVYRPLVSILTPVYNTNETVLKKMLASVLNQTYTNWELCIVDGGSKEYVKHTLNKFAAEDTRIKVQYLEKNLGISGNSNEALNSARGEFIALLDHDDELSPNALYENVALLNRHSDADMIYSDEDKLDVDGNRCTPYFKPDWSPDFFCSSMYTCHLGVYRTSLVRELGGFRSAFDGAQDWDLVLRLSEKTNKIFHIPKVLYHWREIEGSTALSLDTKEYVRDAQIKAVSEHFERLNIKAEVTAGLADNLLRVRRPLAAEPKVSIIIPTRDKVRLLKVCIESLLKRTRYQNYEIIVVDNNSVEPKTLRYFEKIAESANVRVIKYEDRFNFAAINNFAARQVAGELLLFLNNDTEVIAPEWLEAMVEHAQRPEVGAVGARLLYSNRTVQHAGVIVGIGGVAGHAHKNFPNNHPGYFSRAKAIQNLSAVTAACMMVRKDVFESLHGFNEKQLAVAFNDIDFCLRVRRKGLLVVYTPYAELYHHESISRGDDKTSENLPRFQAETNYMLAVWKEVLESDPYYNPNLTLEKENFSIR